MTERIPLSVFIIACDEADRIANPIRSVRDWVDEVVVVDSGSADATVRVAEQAGARVVFNEWPGYGLQKIFAEKQCRNDWLLNLDADEEVGPELAQSIRAALGNRTPTCSAYECTWQLVHWRDKRPRPFALKRTFIRLYDRRSAGFRDSIVHDSVSVKYGMIDVLPGTVWHRSFRSLEHFRTKLFKYAEVQARDMLAHGRKPLWIRLWIEPPWAFVRLYLLRRYFLMGFDGIRMALLYSAARFRRLKLTRDYFRNAQRAADIRTEQRTYRNRY